MASATGQPTVFFRSQTDLEQALLPLTVEEVMERIARAPVSKKLQFKVDPTLQESRTVPLRHRGICNLLKNELYRTKTLTVYYPEAPRVPHHLTIALNRRDIRGLSAVTAEENRELFDLIRKIAEVYRSISIHSFVLAQFDTPQLGQSDRFVVEIIPHLPGFKGVKNLVDKLECNRHVLFRQANISPVDYPIADGELREHVTFWQEAFHQEHPHLREEEMRITFPAVRLESHQAEAEQICCRQLGEILQDRGGDMAGMLCNNAMPTNVPETLKSIQVDKCAFCDPAVLGCQVVFEYGDVRVIYNRRKGTTPGTNFLIIPKRHIEKIYGLNGDEIDQIHAVRAALAEVLKETHPQCQVIVYTQDDPAVGQTVFHSHEQVVAVDPQIIALTWTMLSIYPSEGVSNEEMKQVCEEFGEKLRLKMEERSQLKKTA